MESYFTTLCFLFLGMFGGVCAQCSNGDRPLQLNASRSSNTLYSPGYWYPGRYPNNSDCEWLIMADSGIIKIDLVSAILEFSDDCLYDYIEVFDGSTVNDQQLKKFCTYQLPELRSTGPSMLVRFISDESVTQRGFQLCYQAMDDQHSQTCGSPTKPVSLQADYGVRRFLFSPNYPSDYPDNANCAWRIGATHAIYAVKLQVIDVEMETNSQCSYDYITVYDGDSSFDPLLRKFCSEDGNPLIYSTGRFMYIEFRSDPGLNKRGFKFTYEAVASYEVPTTTTTQRNGYWDRSGTVNAGKIIGGIIGSLIVFTIIVCCCCISSRRRKQASRQPGTNTFSRSHPGPTTIYQNDPAVYIVSTPTFAPAPTSLSGMTNLAYSSVGEAPPPYYSLLHSSTASVSVSAGASNPAVDPPSYTEAMKITHPPAAPSVPSAE